MSTNTDKQKVINDPVAYYKQRVDFLANQKVRVLEELLFRAKRISACKLAEKIKEKI